jgi:hypothetical protein
MKFSMNEYEKQGCLDLTERMSHLSLFQEIAATPGDSSRLIPLSEQHVITATYIDWSSIIEGLQHGRYPTIESWSEAVSVCWVPILNQADRNSLLHSIGEERKVWFKKRALKIPQSEIEGWMCDFSKATDQMKTVALGTPMAVLRDPLKHTRATHIHE